MRYAIATPNLEDQIMARDAGFDYAEVWAPAYLRPFDPEEAFLETMQSFRDNGIKVESFNGFLDPKLRVTGPDADHGAIAEYAETCFRRMETAGAKTMVFGSGGARALPDGWPYAKGAEQFLSLLKRLAPLAENHGIDLVVEPLARAECNFVHTVDEGATFARLAGSPAVGVLADCFHWARNGEPAGSIVAAKDVFRHVHIATFPKRRAPGLEEYDFGPFFGALAEIGYDGRVTVEGALTPDGIPLSESLPKALATMKRFEEAAKAAQNG